MSLSNAYFLFTGLTRENAKFNSKDAEVLAMMLNSKGLKAMNFKANDNLDTDAIGKIRDRYFGTCFRGEKNW